MTTLPDLHRRCLEILEEMPKHPWAVWLKNGEDGTPIKPEEIAVKLWSLNRSNMERIDVVCRKLTLDCRVLNEDPLTWLLVETRVRSAVYFLECLGRTLTAEEVVLLPWETPDDALEWALVRLWPFAGPQWLGRASRLIAAGMDLSSRDLPPSE